MTLRLLLLACASFLLAACSQQELIDKLTPKAESAYAQKVFGDLQAGRYDVVKDALGSSLRTPDIDKRLADVAATFPAGQPRSIKIVGVNTFAKIPHDGPRTTTYNLTYEYEYDRSWVLANIVLEREQSGLRILGLHAQPLAQSLETMNAFRLANKGAVHWIFLVLVVAVPLFCVYAFVTCLRTPNLRRKGLWAAFTLLGFVTVGLNWTTGGVSFQPVSFQLLGAAAVRSGYGPWWLSVSFPLGAVWFLWKRHTLLKRAAEPAMPAA